MLRAVQAGTATKREVIWMEELVGGKLGSGLSMIEIEKRAKAMSDNRGLGAS